MAEVMSTPFGDVEPAAVDAAAQAAEKPKMEEITIKFAKGLCSEPFTGKNGVELVRTQIPNKDPDADYEEDLGDEMEIEQGEWDDSDYDE